MLKSNLLTEDTGMNGKQYSLFKGKELIKASLEKMN
jgi:hypothetical protein